MMALAIPVSSSRLRKTKPLAVPGLWRAMTAPANENVNPVRQAAQLARGTHALFVQPLAMVAHRMRTYGHTRSIEVSHQSFFRGHELKRRECGSRNMYCFRFSKQPE